MDALLTALDVVVPLFLLLLTGWQVSRRGLLTAEFNDAIIDLIYYIFLPCHLFHIMAHNDSRLGRDLSAALLIAAAILITVLASVLLVRRFDHDRDKSGVMIQAFFRGNTAIYGIPFATAVLGADHMGNFGILLFVVILVNNLCAVVILELYARRRASLWRLAAGTLKNPLLLSILLGFLVNRLGVTLPAVLSSAIDTLASVTTGLAFLALGASFTLASSLRNRRRIALVTVVRLVLLPGLWVALGAFVFGFRGTVLAVLLCTFGTPCPVSLFTMAKAMHADVALAGELVVITTLFSAPSLFLFVFLFRLLGYF